MTLKLEDRERQACTSEYGAIVFQTLKGYVDKGALGGFARLSESAELARYAIRWHRNRRVLLDVDFSARSITAADLLPGLTRETAMYVELQAFLQSQQSAALPAHRRLDPRLGSIRIVPCADGAGLTMTLCEPRYEEGLRKFVQVVHELFQDFLCNGPYYEYQIEHLGLDPDALTLG